MIKNYIKIAWRNLWKNKSATTINLVGLITGMSCCLLMVLYIQHELSYDKFQENGDRIARVIMEYRIGDTEPRKGNYTSTKVLPAFKRQFPEVESGVRMSGGNALVKVSDDLYNETRFLFADSTFFSVFSSFPLKEGTPEDVLNAPNKVVLSAATAKRYFKDADPVGKTIQVGPSQMDYLVSGVAEDCPSNSQIKFDFLASFSSLGPAQEETYWNANYTTYLLLNDPSSFVPLQQKISAFMKQEMASETSVSLNFELEPYTRVHLYSPHDGFEPTSNIMYLYIAGGVVLLILLIACFTYINLSTARSLERAKEVGIRKVAGAYRHQLFGQFIGESALLTTLALLLSIGVVGLALPAFNALAGRSLAFTALFQPAIIASMVAMVLCISLLAGSYPAFVLSGFQSIRVLKGAFHRTGSGVWLKQSLIVFQFVISVFLIIATLIMQGQLQYIQQKKLGYDREHVVILRADQKILEKMELVKAELKQHPNVLATSFAYETPVNIRGGYSMYSGNMTPEQAVAVTANPIDEEYIRATGLELIAGEDLTMQDIKDAAPKDDSKSYFHYILNESAARQMGWSAEEAIGKRLFLDPSRPGEVKGVVRDFHFASLHTPIEPLVLFPGGWSNTLIIKTTGNNLAGTLSFLEAKWRELAPHRPFSYQFMDEAYTDLYASELRIGKVFQTFALITILLACLGLFGLSAYTVQQKRKEIGIRKVLGASVSGIVALLSKDFVKLVLIAVIIASPIAWWAMNNWLEDFAYRIDIAWWMFGIAGILAVGIALFTISWQAVQAATSNPVDSLRDE